MPASSALVPRRIYHCSVRYWRWRLCFHPGQPRQRCVYPWSDERWDKLQFVDVFAKADWSQRVDKLKFVGHINAKTKSQLVQIRLPCKLLSDRRKADPMVRYSRGDPVCRRTLRGLLRGPDRFSAKRGLPHNLHSRTGSMDGNVFVFVARALCGYWLGLQCAAICDDGLFNLFHLGDVHFSFVGARIPLGKTDLGNVVGLGRADDIDLDIDVSLHRLY